MKTVKNKSEPYHDTTTHLVSSDKSVFMILMPMFIDDVGIPTHLIRINRQKIIQ